MSEQGPSASSDVSEGVRATKRRRTAQACGPCRMKKTKCDGLQPACTTCTELGYECSYNLESRGPNVSNVTVPKASLQAILDRLQSLEQAVASGSEARASPSDANRSGRQGFAEEQASFMVEDLFHDSIPDLDATGTLLSIAQHSQAHQPELLLQQALQGGVITTARSPGRPVLTSAASSEQTGETLTRMAQQAGPLPGRQRTIHDLEPVVPQPPLAYGSGRHRESPATPALDGMGLLPPVNLTGTQRPAGNDLSPADTGDRLDKEVYGPTSGIHFHSLLLDTLLPGYRCIVSPQDLCGLPPSDLDGDFSGTGSKSHSIVRLNDLPDMMQAEIMWDFFFTRTYPLYPFFSQKAVRTSYEQLLDRLQRRPASGRQTVWQSAQELLAGSEMQPVMALHFGIFGLVQALSNSGEDRTLTRIALKLQRNHMNWPHSVNKVQVLLLGTMLMQGLDSPSQGWDILGYAIRSACAVGLHDPSNSKGLPPEEQEIRCRVWWGCFTFDQLLTVTIGRPSAITTLMSRMPMPTPLPDEPANAIQFFLESIRLYTAFSAVAIGPNALKSSHGPDVRSGFGSIQNATLSIYQIEREYAIWSDGIEPGLSVDLDEPMGPLAHVLGLRGLTMRLLLHRPVLLLAIRERYGMQSRPPSPSASSSRPKGSALRALESSQRHLAFGVTTAAVIDTSILTIRLLQTGAAGPESRSAPWYQLFYAMNAFMSLVGTLMLDLTTSSSIIKKPASEIISSLYAVKNIVGLIEKTFHRPSALRALAIVDQLLKSLGLQTELGGDISVPAGDRPTTVNAAAAAATGVHDTGAPVIDQSSLNGFQDLPQFDLAAFQQTFGLGMLEVADDNPLFSENWGDLFMWQ